jgi:hypothetical protein
MLHHYQFLNKFDGVLQIRGKVVTINTVTLNYRFKGQVQLRDECDILLHMTLIYMKTLVLVFVLKKQDHAYAHIRNNSFKNNIEASNLVDDYLLKITM